MQVLAEWRRAHIMILKDMLPNYLGPAPAHRNSFGCLWISNEKFHYCKHPDIYHHLLAMVRPEKQFSFRGWDSMDLKDHYWKHSPNVPANLLAIVITACPF